MSSLFIPAERHRGGEGAENPLGFSARSFAEQSSQGESRRLSPAQGIAPEKKPRRVFIFGVWGFAPNSEASPEGIGRGTTAFLLERIARPRPAGPGMRPKEEDEASYTFLPASP
jgi:hypothetical protein